MLFDFDRLLFEHFKPFDAQTIDNFVIDDLEQSPEGLGVFFGKFRLSKYFDQIKELFPSNPKKRNFNSFDRKISLSAPDKEQKGAKCNGFTTTKNKTGHIGMCMGHAFIVKYGEKRK